MSNTSGTDKTLSLSLNVDSLKIKGSILETPFNFEETELFDMDSLIIPLIKSTSDSEDLNSSTITPPQGFPFEQLRDNCTEALEIKSINYGEMQEPGVEEPYIGSYSEIPPYASLASISSGAYYYPLSDNLRGAQVTTISRANNSSDSTSSTIFGCTDFTVSQPGAPTILGNVDATVSDYNKQLSNKRISRKGSFQATYAISSSMKNLLTFSSLQSGDGGTSDEPDFKGSWSNRVYEYTGEETVKRVIDQNPEILSILKSNPILSQDGIAVSLHGVFTALVIPVELPVSNTEKVYSASFYAKGTSSYEIQGCYIIKQGENETLEDNLPPLSKLIVPEEYDNTKDPEGNLIINVDMSETHTATVSGMKQFYFNITSEWKRFYKVFKAPSFLVSSDNENGKIKCFFVIYFRRNRLKDMLDKKNTSEFPTVYLAGLCLEDTSNPSVFDPKRSTYKPVLDNSNTQPQYPLMLKLFDINASESNYPFSTESKWLITYKRLFESKVRNDSLHVDQLGSLVYGYDGGTIVFNEKNIALYKTTKDVEDLENILDNRIYNHWEQVFLYSEGGTYDENNRLVTKVHMKIYSVDSSSDNDEPIFYETTNILNNSNIHVTYSENNRDYCNLILGGTLDNLKTPFELTTNNGKYKDLVFIKDNSLDIDKAISILRHTFAEMNFAKTPVTNTSTGSEIVDIEALLLYNSNLVETY